MTRDAPTEDSAPDLRWSVAVITVSGSATLETDRRGRLISDLVEARSQRVRERAVVPDDPDKVGLVLEHWLASDDVDGILLSGGTGLASGEGTGAGFPTPASLSARATSIEVVRRHLDLELPGFAELFRMLSFRHVGPGAMLIGALGGVARGKAVFVMPGSLAAVRIAMEELILPQLGALVGEIRRAAIRE